MTALYWKAAGAVLITVLLGLMLGRQDLLALLTLAGCVLVGLAVLSFLEPVVEFLRRLGQMGDLRGEFVKILLKAVGVGMVTELTAMLCRDGGNASLGQALQMLGSAVILWMSIPLFEALMDLIQRILGEV